MSLLKATSCHEINSENRFEISKYKDEENDYSRSSF